MGLGLEEDSLYLPGACGLVQEQDLLEVVGTIKASGAVGTEQKSLKS